MLANWAKQTVSSGGTGNLTLGSASTGHITLDTAMGQNCSFVYVIENGSDREVGLGTLSASTTLVRSTILETLVSGTLTRSSPSAINVTTSALVMIASAAQNTVGAHHGQAYPASGIEGICSMGQVNETAGNQAVLSNYLHFFPFWWPVSKLVSQAGVWCHTSASSSSVRLGIYSIAANGKPGKLITEFTTSTQIDASTTGAKTISAPTPFWLPSGFYYVGMVGSAGSPAFRCPNYSPSGLFLGVDSSGTANLALYRSFTYAALPADETSQTQVQAGYRMSVWLK